MSLDLGFDLDFDDGQQAIHDAVAQLCRDRCDDEVVKASSGRFDEALWVEVAELGVLGAGSGNEGGALEMCAAMEALGAAVFPGPLVATVLAGQLLVGSERDALVKGGLVVAAGVPPLLPWAPVAKLFLELDGDAIHRARVRGEIEPVETLGGEPWGRVALERIETFDPARAGAALTLADVALAAYVAAAGRRLVADASEHARTRMQFGRAIGEFQAVAHPLADCAMQLSAAGALARAAAFHFDEGGAAAGRTPAWAARRSACRAGLEASYTAHQVFGAIGITLEGPAFHVSRRIRQLASAPPGDGPAREGLLAAIGLGAKGCRGGDG